MCRTFALTCLAFTGVATAGLLPPFPAESAATPVTAPASAVSSSDGKEASAETDADVARKLAADLAKRMQQRKNLKSNSVPVRAPAVVRNDSSTRSVVNAVPPPVVPAPVAPVPAEMMPVPEALPAVVSVPVTAVTAASSTAPVPHVDLTAHTTDASSHPESTEPDGPSAMLLPGKDDSGQVPPVWQETAGAEQSLLDTSAAASPTAVPREELSSAPASKGNAIAGPVFRVQGADVITFTRAMGYKFTPAGGSGPRDGLHTVASQYPRVLSSEVNDVTMSQMRPPAAWTLSRTENTFFMFCDAQYNAVRLNDGWRIRGIRLEGTNWEWVACPRSGASTASFSIRIHAFKNPQVPASIVNLAGITLEGPAGATDWRLAFPSLNGKEPRRSSREIPQPAPEPEAIPIRPAVLAGS